MITPAPTFNLLLNFVISVKLEIRLLPRQKLKTIKQYETEILYIFMLYFRRPWNFRPKYDLARSSVILDNNRNEWLGTTKQKRMIGPNKLESQSKVYFQVFSSISISNHFLPSKLGASHKYIEDLYVNLCTYSLCQTVIRYWYEGQGIRDS